MNIRPVWDSELCVCVYARVCVCPVMAWWPGCIPASHPVSTGLADGWMMVVFSQGNFWQQLVPFDRSLCTFLTCFRGYTCATSLILLVHFHLSLSHFLFSSQWDIVSVGNGPQNGTITVFIWHCHGFDSCCKQVAAVSDKQLGHVHIPLKAATFTHFEYT